MINQWGREQIHPTHSGTQNVPSVLTHPPNGQWWCMGMGMTARMARYGQVSGCEWQVHPCFPGGCVCGWGWGHDSTRGATLLVTSSCCLFLDTSLMQYIGLREWKLVVESFPKTEPLGGGESVFLTPLNCLTRSIVLAAFDLVFCSAMIPSMADLGEGSCMESDVLGSTSWFSGLHMKELASGRLTSTSLSDTTLM